MSVNRGKQFEDIIQKAMEEVKDTVVVRLHDQTTGFAGSKNPCDYVVFHSPLFYAIECKSVHGNTLPFSNITDYQWQSLLEMSNNSNVVAGILCWWVDKDVTRFIPIQVLEYLHQHGDKSIRYDCDFFCEKLTKAGWSIHPIIDIRGMKKRVFFDYDMDKFFADAERIDLNSWQTEKT